MSKKHKKHKIKRDLSGKGFAMPTPKSIANWHTDMAMNDLIHRTCAAEDKEAKQVAADLASFRAKPGRPRAVKLEDIYEVIVAALNYKPALVANPFVTRFCIDHFGLIANLHKPTK